MTAPTRESLESLKRAELQKVCKDYGVRANLKSEALIELVLDATKFARTSTAKNTTELSPSTQSNQQPTSQPQRATSTRIVSSRSTGRTRLRSGGSVIIHETEEGEEPMVVEEQQPQETMDKPDPPPPTRANRKAKDSQLKLGVGRPRAAGGAGARALTKSLSVSKGKRSKSIKVAEQAIAEEPEPEPMIGNVDHQTPSEPGPSGVEHDHPIPEPQPATQQPNSESIATPSLERINEYMNELVRPLQEQITSFKAELERLNAQVAELSEAKAKLVSEVETLRGRTQIVEDDVGRMKDGFPAFGMRETNRIPDESIYGSQAPPSAPEQGNAFGIPYPSSTQSSIPGMLFSNPAPPATALGKRHRDSFSSDLAGVIESGNGFSEGELSQKIVRPQKKRAKIIQDEPNVAGPSQQSREGSHGPGFTVFSGPEERSDFIDPPPPTAHLSDLFGHRQPTTPGSDLRTNSANAPENANPFGLSFSAFQAVTSTPAYANHGLASYLERPESPTSHVIERAGRQDRASPFFLHGHASRAQDSERISPSRNEQGGDTMSALLKTPPLHAVRDLEGGLGIGMPDIRMEDTPAPPVKRTMYGTELEADTRFGDFGVEGIATGFWQGGQRRF